MRATIFVVILAMLTMVNAAPVQEDQKNLQDLLDILADQKTNKESTAQVAKPFHLQFRANKQQDDDDGGSQEAKAQLFHKLVSSFLANKQQGDDDGRNQAEAQFFGHLIQSAVRNSFANKQQDDNDGRNQAEAQLWFTLGSILAPYAIKFIKDRVG